MTDYDFFKHLFAADERVSFDDNFDGAPAVFFQGDYCAELEVFFNTDGSINTYQFD